MNTNDFYKELFEKYALNEDKIRRAAIRDAKTPAWQRAVGTYWKSAVGAAAAVAVTVGAVAYTVNNNGSGNIDIVSSENLLSASQRLHDAEKNYYNAAVTDEGKTSIYISFLDDICYGDMSVSLSALSDAEDIDVECLYLNDSSTIRGKEAIEAYAEANGSAENIAGAKLYAPLRCYRDIQDLSKVYLAELGSEDINDDTFSPIDYDDEDPLSNDYEFIMTTAKPESTTTPFSFVTETTTTTSASTSTAAASETTTVSETSDVSEEDDAVSESETSESEKTDTEDTTTLPADSDDIGTDDEIDDDTTIPAEESGDTEETSVTEADEEDEDVEETEDTEADEDIDETEDDDDGVVEIEAADTTYETTTTAAETTVSITELSEEVAVGLMTQFYRLNVENSLETLLIKDNAIVLTRGEAYVYRLGGMINVLPKAYEISNPKIALAEGNTVIITGCGASGRRNTVLTVDIASGNASFKEAGESLGEAEIGTIHRSMDGKLILKAVSASKTYLYELNVGEEISFRPLLEYNGAVSLAGFKFGKLWFTALDDGMKNGLYSFDCASGKLTKEYSFGTECRVRRSRNFESFIISASDPETDEIKNYVFDINAGMLIPAEITGEALIAVKNGNIYIGQEGDTYVLSSNGTLTATTAEVAFITKPESRFAIVSSDNESIVVAEKTDWNR